MIKIWLYGHAKRFRPKLEFQSKKKLETGIPNQRQSGKWKHTILFLWPKIYVMDSYKCTTCTVESVHKENIQKVTILMSKKFFI